MAWMAPHLRLPNIETNVWPKDEIKLQLQKEKGDDRIPKKNVRNVLLVLEHDEAFKTLYYDTMAGRLITPSLPWRDRYHICTHWTDLDTNDLCDHCEREYGFRPTVETARQAVDSLKNSSLYGRRVNRLLDYLEHLPEWDKKPRIEDYYIKVFGAPSEPYTCEASKLFFLACVSRAFQPGCEWDHVLVLVSCQGRGKSKSFQRLMPFPELFSDSLTFEDLQNVKLVGERTQGKWVMELAEMAGMGRASQRRVKQSLTSCVDSFRAAYAHDSEDRRRGCVFVATANYDGTRGLLTDTTGNRRYWPLLLREGKGMTPADALQWIESNRDQLWAEALYRYHNGEANMLYLSKENEQTAEKYRRQLMDVDHDLCDTIASYLRMPLPNPEKVWEITKISEMRTQWQKWRTFTDEERRDWVRKTKPISRVRVCISEIWQVCLGHDREPERKDSLQITQLFTSHQIRGWEWNNERCRCGQWDIKKVATRVSDR